MEVNESMATSVPADDRPWKDAVIWVGTPSVPSHGPATLVSFLSLAPLGASLRGKNPTCSYLSLPPKMVLCQVNVLGKD